MSADPFRTWREDKRRELSESRLRVLRETAAQIETRIERDTETLRLINEELDHASD